MNNENKPKPHPHAELICKWANEGVQIQKYMSTIEDWRDDANPQWLPQCKYRIKPEEPWKPKKGEKYFYLDFTDGEFSVEYYIWENNTTDNELYRLHNIFHTEEEAKAAIPCLEDAMKIALKGRDYLGSKKSFQLQIEVKDAEIETLTDDIENLKLKISAPNSNNFQLDEKPLSDGEKSLIRAFRTGRLCRQFFGANSMIVKWNDNVPKDVTIHREFVAFFMHSPIQNGLVRSALEQIKEEQKLLK